MVLSDHFICVNLAEAFVDDESEKFIGFSLVPSNCERDACGGRVFTWPVPTVRGYFGDKAAKYSRAEDGPLQKISASQPWGLGMTRECRPKFQGPDSPRFLSHNRTTIKQSTNSWLLKHKTSSGRRIDLRELFPTASASLPLQHFIPRHPALAGHN